MDALDQNSFDISGFGRACDPDYVGAGAEVGDGLRNGSEEESSFGENGDVDPGRQRCEAVHRVLRR